MKYNLRELTSKFYQFNEMKFDSEITKKMAKILIEKFGFSDKKYYVHVNKEVQMFDWEKGDGTLFLVKDGLDYKYEIGQAYGENGKNGKGWFCPDIEECSDDYEKYYHGLSFNGQEKKMTFMVTR